jgi:hypothetical protein
MSRAPKACHKRFNTLPGHFSGVIKLSGWINPDQAMWAGSPAGESAFKPIYDCVVRSTENPKAGRKTALPLRIAVPRRR